MKGKIIDNGYIIAISNTPIGIEITDEEYAQIKAKLDTIPVVEKNQEAKLKVDLTWDIVELPSEEIEEEFDDESSFLDILTGEAE